MLCNVFKIAKQGCLQEPAALLIHQLQESLELAESPLEKFEIWTDNSSFFFFQNC